MYAGNSFIWLYDSVPADGKPRFLDAAGRLDGEKTMRASHVEVIFDHRSSNGLPLPVEQIALAGEHGDVRPGGIQRTETGDSKDPTYAKSSVAWKGIDAFAKSPSPAAKRIAFLGKPNAELDHPREYIRWPKALLESQVSWTEARKDPVFVEEKKCQVPKTKKIEETIDKLPLAGKRRGVLTLELLKTDEYTPLLTAYQQYPKLAQSKATAQPLYDHLRKKVKPEVLGAFATDPANTEAQKAVLEGLKRPDDVRRGIDWLVGLESALRAVFFDLLALGDSSFPASDCFYVSDGISKTAERDHGQWTPILDKAGPPRPPEGPTANPPEGDVNMSKVPKPSP